MNENNTFHIEDSFSDIFNSVYGDPNIVNSDSAEISDENARITEPSFEAQEHLLVNNEEPEFDPRFRVRKKGEEKQKDFSYGGNRVSASQEYDYSPASSPVYEELQSSYGENDDNILDCQLESAEEDTPVSKSGIVGLFKRKKDRSTSAEDEIVADEPDVFFKEKSIKKNLTGFEEDYSGAFSEEDEYIPSASFRGYLSSRIATLLLKLRGGIPVKGIIGSANSEQEFLGEELSPLEASKYYGSYIHSLRLRTRISFLLSLLSLYLSLGAPVPGMLSSLKVASAACLAIELTVMILSLDVVTNALTNCFRKKIGADFLAVVSCIISAFDTLTVLNSGSVMMHMPLCSISTFSLTAVLLSSLLSARALRKSLRVPAIAKKQYAVTTEFNVTGKGFTVLKSNKSLAGFVRRIEEAPVDEIVYSKISVFILVISLIVSILTALIKKSPSRILYVYSVTLCAAVPFTSLLCFALPFFIGSLKIFGSGAAMAGWSGIWDLGHSKDLIVTDTDIFPEECIELQNVKICTDYDPEKVITYAGSLILASGSGLSPVFEKLMEENHCETAAIDAIEYLAGGGIKGICEGNILVVGCADLMRLMNIHVPYREIAQTSVILTINGIVYGIFDIKYKADPKIRKALVSLMRSSRHPVFALRDFNVTPEMLREQFDVATDGYDFPPYAERFRISEAKPSGDSQISAVVCREGLGPLTDVADTARKIYVVSLINTLISVGSCIAGILFSAAKILASGSLAVSDVLIFQLIFSIPVLLLGVLTNTFE